MVHEMKAVRVAKLQQLPNSISTSAHAVFQRGRGKATLKWNWCWTSQTGKYGAENDDPEIKVTCFLYRRFRVDC